MLFEPSPPTRAQAAEAHGGRLQDLGGGLLRRGGRPDLDLGRKSETRPTARLRTRLTAVASSTAVAVQLVVVIACLLVRSAAWSLVTVHLEYGHQTKTHYGHYGQAPCKELS